MRVRAVLGRLFTAAIVTGCAGAETSGPNVVIFIADQLQATRLHCYGNSRPTSPNVDELAAGGTQFTRFYSVAPWTAPSDATLATGLYPSKHGETLVTIRNNPPVLANITTLAQLYQRAGYHTAAFSNNVVAGKWLLGRGFDWFDEHCGGCNDPESRAPEVNRRVLSWLNQDHSRPFFLFLIYWEPHYPYTPREHDIFKSDAYPRAVSAGYWPPTLNLFRWAKAGDRKAVERTVQLYDGYVHYMDHYLGLLMKEFRNRGLFNNTIFLFTSDHGELLFSHPMDYSTSDHRSLYDPVLAIPGIFWGKGVPAGRKIDSLASNLDVVPTLLDLSGLPPKPDAQGISLARLIRGESGPVNEYVFAEQDIEERLRSVRDRTYKLIVDLDSGRKQLFNTIRDPLERQDLSAIFPEITERLSGVLAGWQRENEMPEADRLQFWSAMVADQFPVVAPAGPPAGSFLDDVFNGANVHLSGDGWRIFNHQQSYLGGAYWTDPSGQDQPLRTAIWRPNNPMFGRFRISIWYGEIPGIRAATDVPVTVLTRKGPVQLRLNQTRNIGAWFPLGVFEDPIRVILSNDANGPVIADAVLFERVP